MLIKMGDNNFVGINFLNDNLNYNNFVQPFIAISNIFQF